MPSKYPGWRTMTAAQRYNARKDRIFDEARLREIYKLQGYALEVAYGLVVRNRTMDEAAWIGVNKNGLASPWHTDAQDESTEA
jgi:hypothetical protein